jgi:hypothetical protein
VGFLLQAADRKFPKTEQSGPLWNVPARSQLNDPCVKSKVTLVASFLERGTRTGR